MVSSLQLLRRLPQVYSRLKGEDAMAVSKDNKRSPRIDHIGTFQDVVWNDPIWPKYNIFYLVSLVCNIIFQK